MRTNEQGLVVYNNHNGSYEYLYEAQRDAMRELWEGINRANKRTKQRWDYRILEQELIRTWDTFALTGKANVKAINIIQNKVIMCTVQLMVNTILMGHTPLCPVSELNEIFDDEYGNPTITDDMVESIIEKNEVYCLDPAGEQWALSDYGLPQVEELLVPMMTADTAEEKLKIIDKILNVVHCRGDFAEFFVVGGTATLNKLSTQNGEGQYE